MFPQALAQDSLPDYLLSGDSVAGMAVAPVITVHGGGGGGAGRRGFNHASAWSNSPT